MERRKLYTRIPGRYNCPKCGAPVKWACGSSSKGRAICSRSIYAGQTFIKGQRKILCGWKGTAIRRANGQIEIYYTTGE